MGAPWHVQLLATVCRNLVIKRRDASQTLQEILLPVRLQCPHMLHDQYFMFEIGIHRAFVIGKNAVVWFLGRTRDNHHYQF